MNLLCDILASFGSVCHWKSSLNMFLKIKLENLCLNNQYKMDQIYPFHKTVLREAIISNLKTNHKILASRQHSVWKCYGKIPPLCSGVYQVAWSLRNSLDSGKWNIIYLHRWCRHKRGWWWRCRDGLVLSLMKPLNCAGQWKKQQIYFIKFMMMMMIRIIVMIHVAFTLYYNYNYIVDDDDDVY